MNGLTGDSPDRDQMLMLAERRLKRLFRVECGGPGVGRGLRVGLRLVLLTLCEAGACACGQ